MIILSERHEKMKKYIYTITLTTEIGSKSGTLVRYTEKGYGSEHGSINILGETNPFFASADSNGKYSLSLTLKTLMGERQFEGEGYVYPDKLEIRLRGKRSSCLMCGTIKEVISEDE